MVEEVTLNGTQYVSSRRAAAESGYSQDYIGQLARDGHIRAQRMTGHWYINLPSVMRHKEESEEYQPEQPENSDASSSGGSSVTFDGKQYVSSKKAAQTTGYTQDYVTQLARGNKVPSRQIGRRWLVSLPDIISHKKHNDELLAAVQAESAGFKRPVAVSKASSAPKTTPVDMSTPLRYVQEPSETIPVLRRRSEEKDDHQTVQAAAPSRVHVTDLRNKTVSRNAEMAKNENQEETYDIEVSPMPTKKAAFLRRSFAREEAVRERVREESTRRRIFRMVRNVVVVLTVSALLGLAAYVLIGPVKIDGFDGFANILNAVFGGGETYTRGSF